MQVNSIRRSLGVIARNSSAFGLRQPHLERTRLCELSDADLDPTYVQQRGDLRSRLAGLVKPKVVSGKVGPPGRCKYVCTGQSEGFGSRMVLQVL